MAQMTLVKSASASTGEKKLLSVDEEETPEGRGEPQTLQLNKRRLRILRLLETWEKFSLLFLEILA